MGVHVYCIAPAGHGPAADLRGIDGSPVRATEAGSVCVWLSAHDVPPLPTAPHARVHNDVARAAMTRAVTPVPIRFGQWFASEQAAAAQVISQTDHWQASLAQLAGRAEYGVRVIAAEAGPARLVRPAPAPTGRAYMEALAQRQTDAARAREEAASIAADIEERVADLVADSRTECVREGQGVLAVAHLVAWHDAEAYHTRMRQLAGTRGGVRYLISGPWPPYSFVV